MIFPQRVVKDNSILPIIPDIFSSSMIKERCNSYEELEKYNDDLYLFLEKAISFQDVYDYNIPVDAFENLFLVFTKYYQESLKDPRLHDRIMKLIRMEQTIYFLLQKPETQDVSIYLKLLSEFYDDESKLYEILLLLCWKHNGSGEKHNQDYLNCFNFLTPFLELFSSINFDVKKAGRASRINLIDQTFQKLKVFLKQQQQQLDMELDISKGDLQTKFKELKAQIQSQNVNTYYGLGLISCLTLLMKIKDNADDMLLKMSQIVLIYSEKLNKESNDLKKEVVWNIWKVSIGRSLTFLEECLTDMIQTKQDPEMLGGILFLLTVRRQDAMLIFLEPKTAENGFLLCDLIRILGENRKVLNSIGYPFCARFVKSFDYLICTTLEIAEKIIEATLKTSFRFPQLIHYLFLELKNLLEEVAQIGLVTRFRIYSLVTKLAENDLETMIPALEDHFYLSENRLKSVILDIKNGSEDLSLQLRYSVKFLKLQVVPSTATLQTTTYANSNNWIEVFKTFELTFLEKDALMNIHSKIKAKQIGLFLIEILNSGIKSLDSETGVGTKFYRDFLPFLLELGKSDLLDHWDICVLNRDLWSQLVKRNYLWTSEEQNQMEKLLEISSELVARNQIEFRLNIKDNTVQSQVLNSLLLKVWLKILKKIEIEILKNPNDDVRLDVGKFVYFVLPTFCCYLAKFNLKDSSQIRLDILKIIAKIYFSSALEVSLSPNERARMENSVKQMILQKNQLSHQIYEAFHISLYEKWAEYNKELRRDKLKEIVGNVKREENKDINEKAALEIYWTVKQMGVLEKAFRETLPKIIDYKFKSEELLAKFKENSKDLQEVIFCVLTSLEAEDQNEKVFLEQFVSSVEILGILISKNKEGVERLADMIGKIAGDYLRWSAQSSLYFITRLVNCVSNTSQAVENIVFRHLFCVEEIFEVVCMRLWKIFEVQEMSEEISQITIFLRKWCRDFKLDSRTFPPLERIFKEKHPDKHFGVFLSSLYSSFLKQVEWIIDWRLMSLDDPSYNLIMESIAKLIERIYLCSGYFKEGCFRELESNILKLKETKEELETKMICVSQEEEALIKDKLKFFSIFIPKQEEDLNKRKDETRLWAVVEYLTLFHHFRGLKRVETKSVEEAKKRSRLLFVKNLAQFNSSQEIWAEIKTLKNCLELVIEVSSSLDDGDIPCFKSFIGHLYKSSSNLLKKALAVTDVNMEEIKKSRLDDLIENLTRIFLTFYTCEFSRGQLDSQDLEAMMAWVNLAVDIVNQTGIKVGCEYLLGMLNIGFYENPIFMINLLFKERTSPLRRLFLNSNIWWEQKARGILMKLIDDILRESLSARFAIEFAINKILLRNGAAVSVSNLKENLFISGSGKTEQEEILMNILETNFSVIQGKVDFRKEAIKSNPEVIISNAFGVIVEFLFSVFLELYLENLSNIFSSQEEIIIKQDWKILSIVSMLIMRYEPAQIYTAFQKIDVSGVISRFKDEIPFLKTTAIEEFKSVTLLDVIYKIRLLQFNPESAIILLKSLICESGVVSTDAEVVFDASHLIIEKILDKMEAEFAAAREQEIFEKWQRLNASVTPLYYLLNQIRKIKQDKIRDHFIKKLDLLNSRILSEIHHLINVYQELQSWGSIFELWNEYFGEYQKEDCGETSEIRFDFSVEIQFDQPEEDYQNKNLKKGIWKNNDQNYVIGKLLVNCNCPDITKDIVDFLSQVEKKTIFISRYRKYLDTKKIETNHKTEDYSIMSSLLAFDNLSFFKIQQDEKAYGSLIYLNENILEVETKVGNELDESVSVEVQQLSEMSEKERVVKYFLHPMINTNEEFQQLVNLTLVRLKVLAERISVLMVFPDPVENLKELEGKIVNEEIEKEVCEFCPFEKNLMFCLNKDFNLIQSVQYPKNFKEIQETLQWIRNNLSQYIEIVKSEKREEVFPKIDKNERDSSDPRMLVALSKGLPLVSGDLSVVVAEKAGTIPTVALLERKSTVLIEDQTLKSLIQFFYLGYEGVSGEKKRLGIFGMFEELCRRSEEFERRLLDFCLYLLYCNDDSCLIKTDGMNDQMYEITGLNILKFLEYYLKGENSKVLSKLWIGDGLKEEADFSRKTLNMYSFCDFLIGLERMNSIKRNHLLKDTLNKILIGILDKIRDFKVMKSEKIDTGTLEQKTAIINQKSIEALFLIENIEELLKSKEFILLYNFKEIARVIEGKVDNLIPTLEKINFDLKSKLKAESDTLLFVSDILPAYNIHPLLMSFQVYLEFISSLIAKWFLSPERDNTESIEMNCLKSFQKRILEEKIIEDFMLYLFEISSHLSNNKVPKVPQINKLVTVILRILMSFYTLLFTSQSVDHAQQQQQSTNMIILDFPTMEKIVSGDFTDKKKLPELTSSFSYLRHSREFNYDLLLTDICKKFPDLFSTTVLENTASNKLTTEALILLKKLPWILDFQYKSKFLQNALSSSLSAQSVSTELKKLSIDRSNIIRSTIEQFSQMSSKEVKQKITTTFDNENGIDAGGLRREWMTLVIKELCNPDFGLFSLSENQTNIQPSSTARLIPYYEAYFEFAGIMFAKVIQEGHVVDVNFTKPFLRHLLKRKITLNDLEDIDQGLAKNIKWMVENSVEGLDLPFSYEMEIFGERVTRELVKDGNEMVLDDENKLDFIKRICQKKMKEEMNEGLNAFLKGFHSIIPAEFLSSFSTTELQILISGTPTIDLEAIKEHATYTGYTKDSAIILWLWEILAEFSAKEWSALLFFVTGGTNLPYGGLKSKPLKFRKDWRVNSLPIAHTCFFELELPEYKTKEELKQKLLLAIFEGQIGFYIA